MCHANLAETAGTAEESASVEAAESAAEPERECEAEDRSEIDDVRQISIRVADDENDAQQAPVVVKPVQLPQQNRPQRSKSTRPRKFPQSHSTGHSLIQPGENCEHFTLKLLDDVRKQIMKKALIP